MIDDRHILDAFFYGGAVGDSGKYLVTTSDANILVQTDNNRFQYEPCQLLWVKGQLHPVPLASYAQDRKVALVNTQHEGAEELLKILNQMDLYNTGETPTGVKLYCPLSCDECEMSMRCAVSDEVKRCLVAKPRQADTDGAIFF